ncbi:MAG TPA: hypothetical protein P5107_08715 [Thermotogota bacterium]|nr:hypothetical protein [Thermotogota bacterium]
MTGPVEMQTNFIRAPHTAQQIGNQSSAENAVYTTIAQEQSQEAKRKTESTHDSKKSEQEETKNATQDQKKNAFIQRDMKNKEKKDQKIVEDEFRGHFLDIHL